MTGAGISSLRDPLRPAVVGARIGGGVRRLFRGADAVDTVAYALVGLVLLFAVVGLFWQPMDPYRAVPADALLPPGTDGHLLGTDTSGRDMLSRLLAGAGSTILAAVAVVALTTLIGVVVAGIAAMSPRPVDEAIMRLCDIVMALPAMVLALGIAAALGPSLQSIVVAMTIAAWPGTTRLVRGILRETMAASSVEAARVMGASRLRVMVRHVLPNSLDSVYVQASMEISGTIVLIAGLAYLGVGAAPPSADWGSMVAAGQQYITTAWWVTAVPGLAITAAAVGFGLLGDAIRVRLDPTVGRA
ncbi:MAG: ABC transporter permease [Microbacterium sp.]|uniref:ABC transporter permease n=1 Tax=Microbacterium sp. TaxID=51671 RepID=UPI0039E63515